MSIVPGEASCAQRENECFLGQKQMLVSSELELSPLGAVRAGDSVGFAAHRTVWPRKLTAPWSPELPLRSSTITSSGGWSDGRTSIAPLGRQGGLGAAETIEEWPPRCEPVGAGSVLDVHTEKDLEAPRLALERPGAGQRVDAVSKNVRFSGRSRVPLSACSGRGRGQRRSKERWVSSPGSESGVDAFGPRIGRVWMKSLHARKFRRRR